jgi:lysophospholipase L1-like esterase
VTSILNRRAGIPRFARLVSAGESATVVAFGTSLTLGGAYLDRLPAALSAAYGDARVELINRGRNGYMTLGAAFRVYEDVLPHAPDLVIIEFAHNDVTQVLIDYIPSALEGMLGQIRAAFPACEFVFVYLALPGTAEHGPTPAIEIYEAVANEYGIPSFDLARLSEELVAQHRAIWYGEGAPALTVDGIHHGPAAADLLGAPFAAAFLELLEPPGDGPVIRATRTDALTAVTRVRAADRLATGVWEVRALTAAERRGAGIDEEGLAEAREPGASIRVSFVGTNAFAWVSGSGVLGVRIVETDARYRVGVDAEKKWWLCSLMETHPAAHYTLEVIALNAGLLIGDLSIAGTPA